jgi:hypothetical protein
VYDDLDPTTWTAPGRVVPRLAWIMTRSATVGLVDNLEHNLYRDVELSVYLEDVSPAVV